MCGWGGRRDEQRGRKNVLPFGRADVHKRRSEELYNPPFFFLTSLFFGCEEIQRIIFFFFFPLLPSKMLHISAGALTGSC